MRLFLTEFPTNVAGLIATGEAKYGIGRSLPISLSAQHC